MPFSTHSPIPINEKLTVEELITKLRKRVNINLIACAAEEKCRDKFVREAELNRPGLALTGYLDVFSWQRVQIIGNTETDYLEKLPEDKQLEAFGNITKFDLPIIFLTNGNTLPNALLENATQRGIPIFTTPYETTRFMLLLKDFLDDQFALQTMVHGAMVDVYGVGILIVGKSGIGKSEVALDLVERGHRLVADDVVMITKKGSVLMASATTMSKHFMEIRGLGIVDVMSMFGIRSVRYQKRLEIVTELSLWDDAREINRTGLDHDQVSILDNEIPYIQLPITDRKSVV